MRMAPVILSSLLSVLLIAGCEVEQTEEGELPNVDVEGGNLPEYDVDAPDVDVGTRETEVEVPEVDVDTRTETITVPSVDVDSDDEPESEEREAER